MLEKLKDIFKFEKLKLWLPYTLLILGIFVTDLVTKWVAFNYFTNTYGFETIVNPNISSPQVTFIPGVFYFTCSINTGAAFSLGNNFRWIWIPISIIFGGVLIWYFAKNFRKNSILVKICLSFMIAGAFGNLIDRAFYWESTVGFSGVIDFIYMQIFGQDWFPAVWNIADASLVIGVAILVIIALVEAVKEGLEKDKEQNKIYEENKKVEEDKKENE